MRVQEKEKEKEIDIPDILVDEGSIQDLLCPSGFKFLTNIAVNSRTSELEYCNVPKMTLSEYILGLRLRYKDVALTDAYDCLG